MKTKEIMLEIADIHNNLCNMLVGADNAIFLGDSIKRMRILLDALNQEVAKSNEKGADAS
ncbi:MAG: hypothetical protein ACI3XJ_12670 [Oscillospiraceae bacterium]